MITDLYSILDNNIIIIKREIITQDFVERYKDYSFVIEYDSVFMSTIPKYTMLNGYSEAISPNRDIEDEYLTKILETERYDFIEFCMIRNTNLGFCDSNTCGKFKFAILNKKVL